MAYQAPDFWYKKLGFKSALFMPLSWIYAAIANSKMKSAKREKISAPVLCIGNFTMGGAGKTPTSIAMLKQAKKMGLNPGCLTRGFSGKSKQPTWVDRDKHSAKDVGEEPLMLAEHAPTMVSPDRAEGAKKLVEHGIDFIIMDDGFQSAQIYCDFSLLVTDAQNGLGNQCVFPAGPLRASLGTQMVYTDAVLVNGRGPQATKLNRIAARAGKPTYNGHMVATNAQDLKGAYVLAFAGIGNPQKFFDTLSETGVHVVREFSYPDHHFYNEEDVNALFSTANAEEIVLVTTQKDMMRMTSKNEKVQELAERTMVLEADFEFDDHKSPEIIIKRVLKAYNKRVGQM